MDDRAQMTGPMRLEIVRLLNGPPERVWDYLVDPALREKWFCGGATGTTPGSAIKFAFDHRKISTQEPPAKYADSNVSIMGGEIITFEPPHLLKFTWNEMHVDGSSTVTITLTAEGDKTRLHLIHEGLVPEIQSGVQAGWHAHLDLLKDLLNGQPARDFWLHFNALEQDYEGASVR